VPARSAMRTLPLIAIDDKRGIVSLATNSWLAFVHQLDDSGQSRFAPSRVRLFPTA